MTSIAAKTYPTRDPARLDFRPMTALYHDAQRRLQDQFDTRRLADRIEERLVHGHLDEDDATFITARDMFFLATVDPEGRPNCSYKGGDPGFVRVVDDRTLAFPNYDGNGMYLSMGNVLVNPQVGMLCLDLENAWRMRVDGQAHIDRDDPLLADYHEAQFIVRVTPRAIYPNCPRYIHRHRLLPRPPLLPHLERPTPGPDLKHARGAG